ncbi:MAG: hypothetical protein JW861_06305 [Bacteroidales bacterium]|nr:hypothetical protein [Bacteroidales bacterium]
MERVTAGLPVMKKLAVILWRENKNGHLWLRMSNYVVDLVVYSLLIDPSQNGYEVVRNGPNSFNDA